VISLEENSYSAFFILLNLEYFEVHRNFILYAFFNL